MTRADLLKKLGELRIQGVLLERDWPLVCDSSFRQLFAEWNIPAGRIVDIDALETLAARKDTVQVAIVCTERQEGPVQNKLKEHGIPSIGLFSQLIHRLAAQVAPRFTVAKVPAAAIEYSIVCLPRCGSTLLTQELNAVGAGNPTEHFKAFLQPLLRERQASNFDAMKWWEMVRHGQIKNNVFGTKIIFDIWKMVDKFLNEREHDEIVEYIRSHPVIHLERDDKIGQAVSDVIARRTGVWHLWNKDMKDSHSKMKDALLDEYRHDESKLEADLVDAVQTYRKFMNSERDLLEFFDTNQIEAIHLRYTDLAAKPKERTAAIAKQIGVTIPDDYFDQPVKLEPTTTPAHDLLRERLAMLV